MSDTPRKSLPVPPPAIGSLPPADATKPDEPATPRAAADHVREPAKTAAGATTTGAPRPQEASGPQTGSIPSVGPPARGARRRQTEAGEAAAAGLPAGTLIGGRYEVGAQFGEGGVGLVYRAQDRKLGRDVAVKVMRGELSDHSALRPRFEQEAGALVALVHPNIVTINDYGLVGESPYIVMELLSGQTLRQELDRGPMAEKRAFDIALQLLHGLSYAHAQGVAHRDLKPSNIFLQTFPTQPDVVKILDFGFVAFLNDKDGESNDLAEQDMGFGTPSYMPPEQIRGELARPESDVYAVGLLLFEMLSGHRAYSGELKDIVRGQLGEPLPRLADKLPRLHASDALSAVLTKATEKDPDARFEDAGAMLRELERVPRPATWTESTGGQAALSDDDAEDVTHRVELPRDLPTTATGQTEAPSGGGKAKWAAAALVVVGGVAAFAMTGGDDAVTVATAPKPEPVAEAAPEPARVRQAEPTAQPAPAPTPQVQAGDLADLADLADAGEQAAANKAKADDAVVDAWLPEGLTGHLLNVGDALRTGEVSPEALRAARLQVAQHPRDVKRMMLLGRVCVGRGRDVDALEWYRRAYLADEGVRTDPVMRGHLLTMAHSGGDRQRAFRLAIRIYGKAGVAAVDEALKDGALRAPARATLERLRTMMAAQP